MEVVPHVHSHPLSLCATIDDKMFGFEGIHEGNGLGAGDVIQGLDCDPFLRYSAQYHSPIYHRLWAECGRHIQIFYKQRVTTVNELSRCEKVRAMRR